MNKYQYALDNVVGADYSGHYPEESEFLLQELVDKATPKKPNLLEKNKYSCPSCSMAFELRTSVKNMFLNNQYCDVCGQALDWSDE